MSTKYEQMRELIKKIKSNKISFKVTKDVLTEEQKQNYIERLKICQNIDCWEERHVIADDILCELLNNLGLAEIVEEYTKMEKWFA